MGPRSVQRRAIATVGVLAALLVGAATLRAAIGWEPAAAPEMSASTVGSMSLTDSEGKGAIFTLADMGPGNTGQGEVTISNDGTAPGALSLASTGLSDAPGRYGGLLSERLLLRLEEVGSGKADEVYAGELDAMPELGLGTLTAGESRTYRFLVTMLDGGSPSTPFADDNLYQRATTGIGYEWTLTETEGGGSEPEPPSEPPPAPAPPSAAPTPPAARPPLTGTARADRLVGSSEDDVIRGRGGADRLYGRGGNDSLFGGAGKDRLYGGPGADRIFTRGGGADVVDCGSGRDAAKLDRRDRVKNCESVLGR
jgi:Ca2+-binding RTX toxin-like protein